MCKELIKRDTVQVPMAVGNYYAPVEGMKYLRHITNIT